MELLWKYAEGNCTPDEKVAVERMIASDPLLRKELEIMLDVQSNLAGMEAQSPSLHFTQNVIDALPELYANKEIEPLVKPIWMKVFVGAMVAIFAVIISIPKSSGTSTISLPYLEEITNFINNTVSHLPSMTIQFSILILLSLAMLVFFDKMMIKRVRGLMMI